MAGRSGCPRGADWRRKDAPCNERIAAVTALPVGVPSAQSARWLDTATNRERRNEDCPRETWLKDRNTPAGEGAPVARTVSKAHSQRVTTRSRVLLQKFSPWLAASLVVVVGPVTAASPVPVSATVRKDVAASDARVTNGRLVFTRVVRVGLDEQRNEIYTSRSDGTAVRRLTFRGENTGPQWAPFGKRIVFSRDGDIWVMGANGRHKHRLTGGPAFDYGPAWAPGGRRIVFVRGLESARLVVYSLATGSSRRIPGSFAHPAGPKWSPDGRQIVFAGTVANDSETPDLYTVSPGGRGLRNLTSTPEIWENGPDWSSNGRRIVFVHEGNRCRTLHVMRSDGTADQRVPRSCPAEYPAWSPNGMKIAFNPHPETGGRLWSMSTNGTHKMFITRGDGPDWQPRFR